MRFRLALLLLCPALLAPAQGVPPTASSLVSPALSQLRAALGSVKVEKWKAPGPVRQNASANMGSIVRDLDGTLPALLATADGAPGMVSKSLPVFRNLDALYDVLLRVVESADLAAPDDQTQNLNRALGSLEDARRALGDSLEAAAVRTEGQVSGLEAQLHAPAAPVRSSVVNDGGNDGGKAAALAVHKRKPAKPAAPPQQP